MRTDCYHEKNGQCTVLKSTDCRNCSFFATAEQVRKARQASYDRRMSLGHAPTDFDRVQLAAGQLKGRKP